MCCLFVGGAWKIFCLYILKAHGLRSMGLLCCEVFIRSPTQRSGWAYMFSVCGRGFEDFLFVGGLICFLFVGGALKISLNPSAPNASKGNTLDE